MATKPDAISTSVQPRLSSAVGGLITIDERGWKILVGAIRWIALIAIKKQNGRYHYRRRPSSGV